MSRREIPLPDDGSIIQIERTIFEIALGSMPPEVFAAELSLLSEGLVAELSLHHRTQGARVRLGVRDGDGMSLATVSSDELTLAISRTELEFWIAFFLRYYRDTVADVDHLDLEACRDGDPSDLVDVILRVGAFKAP